MEDEAVVWDALLERWRSWQSPSWWKPVREEALAEALSWPASRVARALHPHVDAGLVQVREGIDGHADRLYVLTEAGLRRAGKAYYDHYAAQHPGVLDAMGRVD